MRITIILSYSNGAPLVPIETFVKHYTEMGYPPIGFVIMKEVQDKSHVFDQQVLYDVSHVSELEVIYILIVTRLVLQNQYIGLAMKLGDFYSIEGKFEYRNV
jgi:hypothetical protein